MSSTTTDPIADMLSRIRNAIMVNKSEISLPHSNIKERVAHLLKDNHFIEDVKVSKGAIGKNIEITINPPAESARISEIVRLSRPGRRQYAGAGEMPVVKRGRGIIIVSTSKGLMTGAEATKQKVGGELICRVY